MTPSIGRIVHYRETPEAPCQAAIVVQVWSPESLNLAVIRDGQNDRQQMGAEMVLWKTSISQNEEIRQDEDIRPLVYIGNPSWHWPERVDE